MREAAGAAGDQIAGTSGAAFDGTGGAHLPDPGHVLQQQRRLSLLRESSGHVPTFREEGPLREGHASVGHERPATVDRLRIRCRHDRSRSPGRRPTGQESAGRRTAPAELREPPARLSRDNRSAASGVAPPVEASDGIPSCRSNPCTDPRPRVRPEGTPAPPRATSPSPPPRGIRNHSRTPS